MITALIILLIAEILYRFFDAEQDTIMFRTPQSWFPKWRWYIENNWGTKSWWLKVPFSMFLDGWHFIKYLMQMVRIGALVLVFCLAYSVQWYYGIGLLIGLYGLGGIIWEITYS